MNALLEIAPEAAEATTARENGAAKAMMLHCGAGLVSTGYLKGVKTPAPVGQHYPTNFSDFARLTAGALRKHGYDLLSQAHALSTEDQRYFGVFETEFKSAYDPESLRGKVRPVSLDQGGEVFEAELTMFVEAQGDWERWNARANGVSLAVWHNPSDIAPPAALSHLVGLRSSHDKKFSNQLVLGRRIFVCDNLAFSGQIMIRRKNTKNAAGELGGLLDRAVDHVAECQETEERRITAYQATPCNGDQARNLIVRSMEAGAIGGAKWGDVVKQFEEPNHVEHLDAQGNPTIWTLENAFTETFKGYAFNSLPERSRCLRPVLDTAADFKPLTATVIDID